jgi:AcrR family transcriptional regulator
MSTRKQASATRRRQILDAALRSFEENGVEGTTVADVRRLSGASVGSIYHHFGGKEELASALYLEAVCDYQRGLLRVLRADPEAEAGIRALVRHHVRWVRDNPALARYLLSRREPPSDELREQNREALAATGGWLRAQVEAGRVRRLPLDLYLTIMIGPAQEFARQWLAGRVKSSIGRAERVLAEAAWRALRADRASGGGSPPA